MWNPAGLRATGYGLRATGYGLRAPVVTLTNACRKEWMKANDPP
jgi:hypothetical protein